MEKLRFAKMYDDVKIPTKRKEDACVDLYARFEEDYLVIKPHETVLIPTGLRTWIPDGYFIKLMERGSQAKVTTIKAGVIDSGYKGEIFVALANHNQKPVIITKDAHNSDWFEDKIGMTFHESEVILYQYSKGICQAALLEVPNIEIEEVTEEEILNRNTERGEGKLGSSNK